jgi:hypothetical protein
MPKGMIQRAYLVPGLPHLVSHQAVESWEALRRVSLAALELWPDDLEIRALCECPFEPQGDVGAAETAT